MNGCLREEMGDILIESILETLEKTKEDTVARNHIITGICRSSCSILSNSKYKKDEKISLFKEIATEYVENINDTIEYFKGCRNENK